MGLARGHPPTVTHVVVLCYSVTRWHHQYLPPSATWSLLNCFCTVQGHSGVCRRKWPLTNADLCPCGETQTMSHIVNVNHQFIQRITASNAPNTLVSGKEESLQS